MFLREKKGKVEEKGKVKIEKKNREQGIGNFNYKKRDNFLFFALTGFYRSILNSSFFQVKKNFKKKRGSNI